MGFSDVCPCDEWKTFRNMYIFFIVVSFTNFSVIFIYAVRETIRIEFVSSNTSASNKSFLTYDKIINNNY